MDLLRHKTHHVVHFLQRWRLRGDPDWHVPRTLPKKVSHFSAYRENWQKPHSPVLHLKESRCKFSCLNCNPTRKKMISSHHCLQIQNDLTFMVSFQQKMKTRDMVVWYIPEMWQLSQTLTYFWRHITNWNLWEEIQGLSF